MYLLYRRNSIYSANIALCWKFSNSKSISKLEKNMPFLTHKYVQVIQFVELFLSTDGAAINYWIIDNFDIYCVNEQRKNHYGVKNFIL